MNKKEKFKRQVAKVIKQAFCRHKFRTVSMRNFDEPKMDDFGKTGTTLEHKECTKCDLSIIKAI